MSVPRRYRVALAALPASYRRTRGPELLATLADGDDDRGHPSVREAAALAKRGLMMRAGLATGPDVLMAAAAALVLLAFLGGFSWAERVYLYNGKAAAFGTDVPGFWWALALQVSAYVVLAAGPFRAAESPRRRRMALMLAAPFVLASFVSPGRLVIHGMPDAAAVVEYLEWAPQAIFHNWTLTLPASIASVLATWIALRTLGRLDQAGRRRALAGALVVLSAAVVAQTWHRPDLAAEYGRSAFADLGPATFMAMAAALLAVAAVTRTARSPSAR